MRFALLLVVVLGCDTKGGGGLFDEKKAKGPPPIDEFCKKHGECMGGFDTCKSAMGREMKPDTRATEIALQVFDKMCPMTECDAFDKCVSQPDFKRKMTGRAMGAAFDDSFRN